MVWLVDLLCLSCHTTPPPSVSGYQIYRKSVCIRVCSSVSVCVGWGVTRSPFGAQSRQNKFCQQSLLGKHDGFWLRLCDKFHLSVCCDTHTHTHTHCPIQTAGVLVTHRGIFTQTFSLPPSFVAHILSMAHTYSLLLSQTHTHTHTAVCLIFLIGCIPRFLSRCLYCMTYTNTLTVVIINHIHTDCAPLFHSLCVIQILYTALRSLHLLKMTDMWSKSLCHAHYFGARYHAGIHMFVVL